MFLIHWEWIPAAKVKTGQYKSNKDPAALFFFFIVKCTKKKKKLTVKKNKRKNSPELVMRITSVQQVIKSFTEGADLCHGRVIGINNNYIPKFLLLP